MQVVPRAIQAMDEASKETDQAQRMDYDFSNQT
jgi:hypothetical protein